MTEKEKWEALFGKGLFRSVRRRRGLAEFFFRKTTYHGISDDRSANCRQVRSRVWGRR